MTLAAGFDVCFIESMGFDWLVAGNHDVELVAHQLKELLLGAVRRGHSFKFEQIAYK